MCIICNQPVAGSIPIASSNISKALGNLPRPFLLPEKFSKHIIQPSKKQNNKLQFDLSLRDKEQ
jgi:hypothetical protein